MAKATVKCRLSGKIQPVMRGVNSVLKCDYVAGLLGQQAEKCAAACNRLYSASHTEAPEATPYVAEIVQRRFTAGGLVRVNGVQAYRDNLKRNTLKKGCGI